MSSRSSHNVLLFLAAGSLLLAACGGSGGRQARPADTAGQPADVATARPAVTPGVAATPTAGSTPDAGSSDAAFPVTIDTPGGAVAIEERPDQIVSLSPTATEMLYAIGAGDQVIAVDEQSDYPPEAPTTELSGFQPNIEAIAAYEPDLVVTSGDTSEGEGLTASLVELDIPVLVEPGAVTIDDTYTQIEQLGAATGHIAQAAEVVAQIRTDLREIVSSMPDFAEPPAIYHELDPSYYSATSATFIGSIYELLGATNIADEAESASDYPQLSAEYIIEANPEVIFLADSECCDVTAESVAERPGWGAIAAVAEGNVVEVGDDISSRWGPRVVDFAQIISDALAATVPAGTS